MSISSSLARRVRSDPDLPTLRARAWREKRVLVVPVDDVVLSWPDRAQLERIATALYGPSQALRAINPKPRVVE